MAVCSYIRSRLPSAIYEVLQKHKSPLNRYEIAERVYCDPVTAGRVIKHLREVVEAAIYVARWDHVYKQCIPAYCFGIKKDVPKPSKVLDRDRLRKKRKLDPEFCVAEAAKKRAKRERMRLLREAAAPNMLIQHVRI